MQETNMKCTNPTHPKRLLVLATGGTIVCSETDAGLRPQYNIEDLLKFVHPLSKRHVIDGKTVMNIDSSNMTPQYWLKIAWAIETDYNNYDGFVITHGTDTMAYTASALTYILQNLNKPVILTGSQYSIMDKQTDAIQNLNDALLFACEELMGVFIVFDGKLINGTRAIKIKTKSYNAFKSVNFPSVAVIKHNRIYYNQAVFGLFAQKKRHSSPHFKPDLTIPSHIEDRVFVLKVFPGLDPTIFDYFKENMKGVIIESYGIGGISSEILDLSTKVKELIDAGIAVAITTQCLMEGVNLHIYEVGKRLPLEKIIYTRDMNTEALVSKLMWALGMNVSLAKVKRMVETPMNGDMQEDNEVYFNF